MKRAVLVLLFAAVVLFNENIFSSAAYIRVNLAGYQPKDSKFAVLFSNEDVGLPGFSVVDADSGERVFGIKKAKKNWGAYGAFKNNYILDFSGLRKKGTYKIVLEQGSTESAVFKIGRDIYKGDADLVLNFFREQRCGYNPFLKKTAT